MSPYKRFRFSTHRCVWFSSIAALMRWKAQTPLSDYYPWKLQQTGRWNTTHTHTRRTNRLDWYIYRRWIKRRRRRKNLHRIPSFSQRGEKWVCGRFTTHAWEGKNWHIHHVFELHALEKLSFDNTETFHKVFNFFLAVSTVQVETGNLHDFAVYF